MLVETSLKTPITYYGGKQRMLRHILPLIPAHNKYVEPFCGGAAVFFAKQPAKLEVINDKNGEVINFYRCCKDNMPALKARTSSLLYARFIHSHAKRVYKNPQAYNKIERATAFFTLSAMSFGSVIGNTFAAQKKVANSSNPIRIRNKKKLFSYHLAARFENAIIECLDAVYLIKKYDSNDAFFYIDPPYYNADMGHYGGYTEADFEQLLQVLSELKGKFLLSCYPSDLIEHYTQQNQWKTKKVSTYASATLSCKDRQRTEVLTANYEIN